MLCMFTSWSIVWHHASQTAKYLFSSNLGWISLIYKAIIEPSIFPSLPTFFLDQFGLVLLFSSKAFLVASQWRNNNFHFSRIEEMRPQAMMELYLFLKNKERHILEGNPLKGSLRNVTWKAKTATSVKRMVCTRTSLRLTEHMIKMNMWLQ